MNEDLKAQKHIPTDLILATTISNNCGYTFNAKCITYIKCILKDEPSAFSFRLSLREDYQRTVNMDLREIK
jgi:hypothetical protein